jgi:multidrug resistance efflux pump
MDPKDYAARKAELDKQLAECNRKAQEMYNQKEAQAISHLEVQEEFRQLMKRVMRF